MPILTLKDLLHKYLISVSHSHIIDSLIRQQCFIRSAKLNETHRYANNSTKLELYFRIGWNSTVEINV